MQLRQLSKITANSEPLNLVEMPIPAPQPHEILLRVHYCGVCHTELDEIEGRLPPPELPVIPGHQVIAEVAECGAQATNYALGDRVGVGWIHQSDGTEFENLADTFVATGCDTDGGYAQFMTVPERYAVPIPEVYGDAEAAPLLCAGAIGYRALKLTGVQNGQPLGLCGFGASAHIVLQLAKHCLPDSPIFVFTRTDATRGFARDMGASWTGAHNETSPEPMQAIIDTTPAWLPIVQALQNLAPGGRLVINAIRKESRDQTALQQLSYAKHLWMEREIKSVANITRADIAEFLPLAAAANIRPKVVCYPLEQANEALCALKFRPTLGAKVLRCD